MANTKLLVAWLNDAYGMEQAQVKMLGRFAGDFKDDPDIQSRLQEHLETTRRQADDIKSLVQSLGSDVSSGKSMLGNIMGAVQGMSTGPFKDKTVKDLILLHAGEHFEHASYIALVAGARVVGEGNVADVCERIAQEEKAMADWAEQELPLTTAAVMDRAG